jgi:hypothetical protein
MFLWSKLYVISDDGLLHMDCGFAHGLANRKVDGTMFRSRALATGMAGLAACLAASTINCDAQESETAITCINPVSGTSWQIVIDYGKATVDSNPAEITRTGISWFDRKDGGNYRLDRESGDLIASVASSTGGYFRHGRCRLEKQQ